jgi:hypothetical protein
MTRRVSEQCIQFTITVALLTSVGQPAARRQHSIRDGVVLGEQYIHFTIRRALGWAVDVGGAARVPRRRGGMSCRSRMVVGDGGAGGQSIGAA